VSGAPRRLSREEVQALKFAAHRQLARWAKNSHLRPRQREQRTNLVRAVRVLDDQAFAEGVELRAARDGSGASARRAPGRSAASGSPLPRRTSPFWGPAVAA
jgi:hypothetical protein